MFLTSNSKTMNKIFQSLSATKELFISSLIYGQKHTGKKSLVQAIFSDFLWVSGKNLQEVQNALKDSNKVVITDFELINNYDYLDFENSNVVAIYNGVSYNKALDNKFAFIYYIPPLKERSEDIELFSKYFLNEAKELFNINKEIELNKSDLDISKNLKSLKSSVYKAVILKNMQQNDIYKTLYHFFLKNYEGDDIYKKHLSLFEKALISAGLDIYGSQLKLSSVLGINRNTLRKKINEYFRD
jgi:DNA-binding NtrC family response regulator